jgi:uncharacterized membrane protein
LKAINTLLPFCKEKCVWVVLSISFVFSVYSMMLQMRRFACLGASAFDLGIFQQAVWLLAQRTSPFVTLRGMNIFADHFTPILYLFTPFYRLWEHPFWLFLGQTMALAIGAIPIYRLTLHETAKPWAAALIVVGYFFHPATFTMLLFDFHPVVLSVPFVLWAMYAIERGLSKPFFIAICGGVLCKEEIAFILASLSAYGAIVKRCRWAWLGLLVNLAWLWFSMKLMALLGGVERSAYLSLYAQWGQTPAEIIWGILTHPVKVLKAMVADEYPLLLLSPLAFLPLWSADILAFGLPTYLLLVLSDRPAMHHLGYHYSALIMPWLMFASILAWKRLLQFGNALSPKLWRRWQVVIAIAWIVCLLFGAFRYGFPIIRYHNAYALSAEQSTAIVAFLNRFIPPDASVSAPTQLVPPLAHRHRIYLLPNPFYPLLWGPSVEAIRQQKEVQSYPLTTQQLHYQMRLKPVDFIVLKAQTNYLPLSMEAYDKLALDILTCPDYGVIAIKGDVIILRRKANFYRGLNLLGIGEIKPKSSLQQTIRQIWLNLRISNSLSYASYSKNLLESLKT